MARKRRRRTFRDELVTGLISAGMKEAVKEENRKAVAAIARFLFMAAAVVILLGAVGLILA